MNITLMHFNMHGYGGYIFSAYAVAAFCLGTQIYRSVKRSKYIRSVINAGFIKS